MIASVLMDLSAMDSLRLILFVKISMSVIQTNMNAIQRQQSVIISAGHSNVVVSTATVGTRIRAKQYALTLMSVMETHASPMKGNVATKQAATSVYAGKDSKEMVMNASMSMSAIKHRQIKPHQIKHQQVHARSQKHVSIRMADTSVFANPDII